jgi:Na+/melibiose symporter-like transporter
MFEMLVFIFGVYALVFGSVNLPWNLSVSGWRARVAGLFLMAPLPLLVLLGRVVGQGIDAQTALSFYGILELILVLLGILGAALFVYLTRQRHEDIQTEEDPDY